MSAKKAAKKTAKKAAKHDVEEHDTQSGKQPEDSASSSRDEADTNSQLATNKSEASPPISPNRESVAALATQIVAAQITGIAHHETTTKLWDGMLGALGAVVSHLEKNRDAKLTHETLASALTSGLRWGTRRIPRPDVLGPIGFAGVEPLTDSAIRYAENLLEPSRARHVAEGSIVFAEQLFGLEETLSENGIIKRFNDFQWPKLSSPTSVRYLLAALDEWYAEWIALESTENGCVSMPPVPRGELKDSTILVRALKILQGMDLEPGTDFALSADAANGLKFAIHKKTGFPVNDLPRSVFRDMDWDLIEYFYCGEAPSIRLDKKRRAQEQESPSKGETLKKKGDQMDYRPCGLFRYLRLFGENESAQKLNNKLMMERKDLNPIKTPEPLYNDLYEMKAIEQIVRPWEDEWP
jgi:hypothetical protein